MFKNSRRNFRRAFQTGLLTAGALAVGRSLYRAAKRCSEENKAPSEEKIFDICNWKPVTPEHDNGMILSREFRKPLDVEKYGRSLNALLVGAHNGVSSCIAANLLQMNTSYVINDPGGDYYRQYADILAGNGYRIRCLNLADTAQSNHYNPFAYIRSDEDIVILAEALLAATRPKDKRSGDLFWDKTEMALLTALIAYLYHYTDKQSRNFFNIVRLLNAGNLSDDSPTLLDDMINEVAEKDPDGFAVREYKTFKMGCPERVQKSILFSCFVRLQAFELKEVIDLTYSDDIALDTVGDEKTALFVIFPPNNCYFSFLATVLYAQMQRYLTDYAWETAKYASLVLDGDGQVVRTFRADSQEEADAAQKKAAAFLCYVKNGDIIFKEYGGTCTVCMKENDAASGISGPILSRRTRKDAQEAFGSLRRGQVVKNAEHYYWSSGYCLPVHVQFLFDGFDAIVPPPRFIEWGQGETGESGTSFIVGVPSLDALAQRLGANWEEIAHCDTVVFFHLSDYVKDVIIKLCKHDVPVRILPSSQNRPRKIPLSQFRVQRGDECVVFSYGEGYIGHAYTVCQHPAWRSLKY